MMPRNGGKNRDRIGFTSPDELVPEEHLARKLENAIDRGFIYEMVEDSYCEDNGRPSHDPVILIKLPALQCMLGIRSMRQTIQEIKVNNAYRWFLGLGLHDAAPHFSTFGKNYMRRFHVKVVTRRVWQDAVDEADENRYRYDLKELYKYRKETIERIFGLAKEQSYSFCISSFVGFGTSAGFTLPSIVCVTCIEKHLLPGSLGRR